MKTLIAISRAVDKFIEDNRFFKIHRAGGAQAKIVILP